MADPPPDRAGPPSGTTGSPAWLKALGIALLVVVVVIVVVIVATGVDHGPRMHGAP